MNKKKICIVVGPTASGKSDFAVRMAQKINGEVVNADSMQIYKDLQIITARPTIDDMQEIPHHLYGYFDSFQTNSVQLWLDKVVPQLKQIERPVVVGGTGMYINALINGISPIPEINSEKREFVRSLSLDEVKKMVVDCSALDNQRLRRALEVQLSTGKPLSYFQQLPRIKMIDAEFDIYFINPKRDILYQNCNNRLIKMLQSGAIDEVQNLINMNATGSVLKAIGVPEIIAYLQNDLSYDDMCLKIQLSTRHYAKRQVTWFKHQLDNYTEIENPYLYEM